MYPDHGAFGRDGRGGDIGHRLHRVRIADRQHGDADNAAIDLERPAAISLRRLQPAPIERNAFRVEYRRLHADRHLPIGLQARRNQPGQRLDADLGLVRQPFVVHETHEAARAVAALLDFAAVGVPDAVAEVGLCAN